MYIEELRLKGFKSFADSLEMPLSEGLTVMVGPNGAGKSNIIDGVRWVSGESSAKKVRGGELEDLIFSGTKERMPLAGMEVGISIKGVDREKLRVFGDNIDKDKPCVDLVRRLEKGKGSTYRLNGKEVLKREVDIFLGDIAFGGAALSIVGQGLVSDIVSMGGAKRRKILEATSGLQGLRERYLDAGMRLQGVETNLEKLEEFEIIFSRQIADLEEQAKKVRLYRGYSAQIRSIALYGVTRGVTEMETQLSKLEIEESEKKTEEIKVSREIHKENQILSQMHEQIKLLRNAKEERFADEREARFALRSLEMKEEQTRAELTRQEEEKHTIGNDLQREQQELEQATTNIATARNAQSLWEDKRLESAQIAEKKTNLQTLYKSMQEIEKSYEKTYSELTVLVKEKEKRQDMFAFASNRLKESELVFNKAEEANKRAIEAWNSLQDTADSGKERAYLVEQLEQAEEQINVAEEKRELLVAQREDAQNIFDTNKKDQQHLLQNIRENRMNAEVESQTLQRILFDEIQSEDSILKEVNVEKGYEAAVDNLWGERLLSGKITEGMLGQGWRSDLGEKRVTQVKLEGVEPLSNFVGVPSVAAQSLSKVGVVDSIEQGFGLQTQLQEGEMLVTKDGSIWHWDGYVKITSEGKKVADSLLTLKKRYEELLSQIKTLSVKETAAKKKIEYAQQTFDAYLKEIKKDIAEQENLVQEAQMKRDEIATDFDEVEKSLQGLQRERERAEWEKKQKEEAYQQVKTSIEKEHKSFKNHELLYQEMPNFEDKEQHLELLKTKRKEGVFFYEREGKLLNEMERESAVVNEKLALIARDILEWEGRMKRAQDRIDALHKRERALEEVHSKAIENPQDMALEKQKLLVEIEKQVGLCNEAEQNLLKLEAEERHTHDYLRERERSLSKIKESLAALRTRKEMLKEEEKRLQTIKEEKEREYTALGSEVNDEQEKKWRQSFQDQSYEELQEQQKQIETKRERMGAVNLLAEQELKAKQGEQEERLLQIKDIRDSAMLLKRSREGLEKEAVGKFLEIFEKVNQFFGENFRHVFGGGSASLLLSDPSDVLHSEVDVILSLPGKRVKHLSLLSGGEQTLVALCLLFAMFRTYKAPLYVLDEVDAALDDVNVGNFCELLRQNASLWGMRFLIVSHHRLTMASADKLFGVTMVEKGVSKLVSVDLVDALEHHHEKTK